LTYTQYIALLVLWEQDGISIKDLGEHLMLDSGTLTPLVKKLEKQGLLKRERGQSDERYVSIVLTEEGRALKLKASDVPFQIAKHLHLDEAEGYALKQRLDQFILDNKHLD